MDSFLENLKLQVQCSLCNETMVEPKLLECFHTFCKPCIQRNKQLDGQVNIFSCPQCESLTELQELNDVEDLEISPIHSRILQVLSFVDNQKVCSVSACHSDALWRCLDCDRSLCDECLNSHSIFTKDHRVISLSEMTKEDIEFMLKKESPCKIHANHDMESYCQDCDKPICPVCLRDYHTNHTITSLHEFIATKKDSLSKNLEEIDSLNSDEEENKQQEQIAAGIKRDGQEAQRKVKELTKKLVKTIIDQEQELLNKIQKSITKADWNLRIIRHTPAAQEYINYLIENGTASDMVDIGSGTECSKTFTFNAFEKHIAGMEFKPNEKLAEEVNTGLGLVRETFKKADPKKSIFKVNPKKFVANKSATLIVGLNQGEPCDSSLDDVKIHITPKDDVIVGEKQVTANGHILKVTFTPRVSGHLTAEVQVHGSPISNSPLVMDVKPQYIQAMTMHSKLQIALNTGSKNLSGIAANKSNTKIAVADSGLHCVRVFNMEGDLLLSYGSKGSGEGQLNDPQGIAFLNETDLVIADYGNRRIRIVDTTSGNLEKTFGYMTVNGQPGCPRGIHVDKDSNIVVCDPSGVVQVLTQNGGHICQFTVPNCSFLGLFCAIKHNGLFYVSEGSKIEVIQVRDNHSLTTVNTIGQLQNDGFSHSYRGLAIDNDNNLLVCDAICSNYTNDQLTLRKFTLDGRCVGMSTAQQNFSPKFIVVLNDGRVICTSYKGRVLFFY